MAAFPRSRHTHGRSITTVATYTRSRHTHGRSITTVAAYTRTVEAASPSTSRVCRRTKNSSTQQQTMSKFLPAHNNENRFQRDHKALKASACAFRRVWMTGSGRPLLSWRSLSEGLEGTFYPRGCCDHPLSLRQRL